MGIDDLFARIALKGCYYSGQATFALHIGSWIVTYISDSTILGDARRINTICHCFIDHEKTSNSFFH